MRLYRYAGNQGNDQRLTGRRAGGLRIPEAKVRLLTALPLPWASTAVLYAHALGRSATRHLFFGRGKQARLLNASRLFAANVDPSNQIVNLKETLIIAAV